MSASCCPTPETDQTAHNDPRWRRVLWIALIAILLVIQMWLLTATLEAHLAGHSEPILPGAIISAVIFAACGGLFLFIRRIDADLRSHDEVIENVIAGILRKSINISAFLVCMEMLILLMLSKVQA